MYYVEKFNFASYICLFFLVKVGNFCSDEIAAQSSQKKIPSKNFDCSIECRPVRLCTLHVHHATAQQLRLVSWSDISLIYYSWLYGLR